jgi:hypothetical protein
MAPKTLADVGPGLYLVSHAQWRGILLALVRGAAPYLDLRLWTYAQGALLECGKHYAEGGADFAPRGFTVIQEIADADAVAASDTAFVHPGARVFTQPAA